MVFFLLFPLRSRRFAGLHRLLPELVERTLPRRLLLGQVDWLVPVPAGLPAGLLELPVEPLEQSLEIALPDLGQTDYRAAGQHPQLHLAPFAVRMQHPAPLSRLLARLELLLGGRVRL